MTTRPSSSAATVAAAGPKSLPRKSGDGHEREDDGLPRLVGRYALLKLLVRGGMGEVYLATTIGIEGAERPCVVKRIRSDYREDPSFQARFLDEARVQSQLDDPGVARIMEASVDAGGDPYVVVEFVEGRSLADVRSRLSRQGKTLPWADAVAVTLEIASALTHVHERTGADGAPLGIVHRDLSPQNVMIGFGGDVKLIDFGTARGENRRCHTVSGTVLAKPGYVGPEVAKGESATARADIYALGVMLWELVIGRRFLEGDATEHVAAVTNGSLRPRALCGDPTLAQLGDGPVPADLDRVIAWMTEPVASERCGRAREAAKALAGILTQAPRKPVEERGVRARVKAMLTRLYPGEPSASRVDFARLVARARKVLASELSDPPSGAMKRAQRRDDSTPDGEPLTGVPDALPGTRYRLVRKLGEGAMGVVYEAEHVDLGRRVAVKVLQGKHAATPEFIARFRREARAIAGLSHPNLVHVYDFGQTKETDDEASRLFFVMERLEGETLEDYLTREQGLDYRDACELAIKTCRALEAAHAAGLVHRDLKPANLFLTYAGQPPRSLHDVGLKLLDFGVAKGSHDVGALADDPNLSKAGAIFGTPETMAPEQASAGVVDGRADLYGLGCVLYQLVTGQPVFDAPSPILLMSCHMRDLPKPPREVAPLRGIPEAVEQVILRALSKDPNDRFADASEMRESLEDAIYGSFFENSENAGGPKDEAVDIMLELGLHEKHARLSAPAAAILSAGAAAGEGDESDDEDEDEDEDEGDESDESDDERVQVAASSADETPLLGRKVPRRRGIGGKLAAFALGLSLLAGAGYLQKDALRSGYEKLLRRIDSTMAPATNKPRTDANATNATNATGASTETGGLPKKTELFAPKPVQVTPAAVATTTTTTKVAPAAMATAPMPSAAASGAGATSAPSDVDLKLAAGDVEGALAAARIAKIDGTPSSLRAWARAAFANARYGEAHEAATMWIAKVGDEIEPKMLDARALHAAGRDDEAKARLREILETHAGCAEAKSMLRDLEALAAKKVPGKNDAGKAKASKPKPTKATKHRSSTTI